jgi:hypothetical protein
MNNGPGVVVAHNLYALLDSKKKKKSSKARGHEPPPLRTPLWGRGAVSAHAGRAALTRAGLAPQDAVDTKRGSSSKKSSKKTVELDEKLWSQTQLSVASWADCDDEDTDAPFDAPAPSGDAGARVVARSPRARQAP